MGPEKRIVYDSLRCRINHSLTIRHFEFYIGSNIPECSPCIREGEVPPPIHSSSPFFLCSSLSFLIKKKTLSFDFSFDFSCDFGFGFGF